jgi:hypothetical protein
LRTLKLFQPDEREVGAKSSGSLSVGPLDFMTAPNFRMTNWATMSADRQVDDVKTAGLLITKRSTGSPIVADRHTTGVTGLASAVPFPLPAPLETAAPRL